MKNRRFNVDNNCWSTETSMEATLKSRRYSLKCIKSLNLTDILRQLIALSNHRLTHLRTTKRGRRDCFSAACHNRQFFLIQSCLDPVAPIKILMKRFFPFRFGSKITTNRNRFCPVQLFLFAAENRFGCFVFAQNLSSHDGNNAPKQNVVSWEVSVGRSRVEGLVE